MIVDIWVLRPGPPQDMETGVQALLAFLDEKTRARTLAMADVRDAWGRAGAHALCRGLLCAHFGTPDGAAWSFDQGPFGKPCVPGLNGDFSLTHTRGLCACALVRGTHVSDPPKVGLDAEPLERSVDAVALARRFLHPREAAWVAATPVDHQAKAFVRLWTVKEAVVKALGGGLQENLRGFCVDPALDPPRLVLAPPSFGPLGAWTLETLSADPAFALSLAVQAQGEKIVSQIRVLDGVGDLVSLLASR